MTDAEMIAEVRASGWQPIESAPRDGESVLIWKPNERMVGAYMMAAYWHDNHFSGEPGWVPVGGYHRQGYHSEVTDSPQGYPTHWMPLPAAPGDDTAPHLADRFEAVLASEAKMREALEFYANGIGHTELEDNGASPAQPYRSPSSDGAAPAHGRTGRFPGRRED